MLRICFLLCCVVQVNSQFNIFAALFGGNAQFPQTTNSNKQLPLLFTSNVANSNTQRRGSLAEIFDQLAVVLKPLLPFVNVLLQQITELLKSLITNLKNLLEKLVSLLDMILPDWRKLVRQLVATLVQLINKHLPELKPLLQEVIKILVPILQLLFSGRIPSLDQLLNTVQ